MEWNGMKMKWNETKQNAIKKRIKRIDQNTIIKHTVPEMLINLKKDFELFAADLEAISTCVKIWTMFEYNYN